MSLLNPRVTSDTALPPITDIQRMSVRPGDVIVVRYDRPLRDDETDRASAWLKRQFPDNKIVVTGPSPEISVLGPDDTPPISER